MRFNIFALGLAFVLGLAGVVGLADVAVAQASAVDDRKGEEDKILQQCRQNVKNVQQNGYNIQQRVGAVESCNEALASFRLLKNLSGESKALSNLAILYNTLATFDKAIEFQEQSLAIAREIKDRGMERNALDNLGFAYLTNHRVSMRDLHGNSRKAIEFYKQSLAISRELKDRLEEGNALGNLGRAYRDFGNYLEAIEFYKQSLAIARELKDRLGEGKTLGNLGITYQALDNYPKAIEFYEQQLSIAREIKDIIGEQSAISNLADSYYTLKDYAKTIEFQEKYLGIATQIRDELGEKEFLLTLGNIYGRFGSYAKTIEYYERSLTTTRRLKNRVGERDALNNLGTTYYSLGNCAKSIEYHEKSLAVSDAIGMLDTSSMGIAFNGLGLSSHACHNNAKAIKYYEQSLAIVYRTMGVEYDSIDDYIKERELQGKKLAVARTRRVIVRERWLEGRSLSGLGLVYDSLGDYAKALEFQEKSLAITREIKDRDGEQITLNNLGRVLTKREPELAIIFYKQSVNISESIRKENPKLDRTLQESYLKTVAGTYRNLADLLLSRGRVQEAQQVLELLKIQELRDFTKDTRFGSNNDGTILNPVEQPIPAAFNDKIALGIQLTQCEQTKCADRPQLIAQRDNAKIEFDTQVKRLKKLLNQQQSTDPAQLQSSEFTRAAQDITLANPNTVLIYPLVLDDKLWLVWSAKAGKGGVIFDSKEIPVKRKDLSTKVAELQTLLTNRTSSPKELQKVSQQLYQWLIAPIRPQLDKNGIKNIIFSLDRATRYIPMATLHDGKQYLIENFAISTILTAQTDTRDRLSSNLEDDKILGLGLTQSVSGFASLPAVKTELDGIIKTNGPGKTTSGIYPGTKLFDREFTETALRNNIADHRILHIATHGSFVPGNPEDSFLVLGDGKKLSISTIQSMALAETHLVVLSACETGKGGVDKEGIEVAGLGHYFLRSGAKSVMASLWLVNDPATSLLMREFYSQLSKGTLTKAEALRQVQIAFLTGKLTNKDAAALDRAGGRRFIEGQLPVDSFAHPYYWAPFILIGNSQ